MRNRVLYVGGFLLPDRSASALRALGNAAALRSAGYDVTIAGKLARNPELDATPIDVHGFRCHDIRRPLERLHVADYTVTSRNVDALLHELGTERIAAIMAYNYPGFGLHGLVKLARRLRIPIINESTEWYGWEGFRPISNIRRIVESGWRNGRLVEAAGNFVCATQWSRKRHPGVNTLVLPFALDPAWEVWQSPPLLDWCGESDAVRFVYSGSPGEGMHKDRLPLIVEALDRAAAAKRFALAIVGMHQDDYLRQVPHHRELLRRHSNSVRFLGRLPHRDAVGVLKSADFAVFVRARNRVSEVGFPTKYAEAATCGIPVFTNATSDLADYLTDGVNGILLRTPDLNDLTEGFRRAVAMSLDQRIAMKRRAAEHNPFAVSEWVERLQTFMAGLRLPR